MRGGGLVRGRLVVGGKEGVYVCVGGVSGYVSGSEGM